MTLSDRLHRDESARERFNEQLRVAGGRERPWERMQRMQDRKPAWLQRMQRDGLPPKDMTRA